ncbi:MAG: flagellar protein FlgN [Calditrichae bacterium]|nr:flagellar protein FlgN [Calditrichota bacterium]MCB9059272.1 flagellar protein FlgN [Calditrichia bacterium]
MNSPSETKRQTQLDEVFRNLVEEVSVYESLAESALNKQKAIIKNDVPALKRYSDMEQTFVKKGNSLTDNRLRLIHTSPHDKKNNSLSVFISKNGLFADREWSNLENRLNTALNTVKRLNIENAMLLKTSLGFTQNMIKMFYPKDKKMTSTYTREGKTRMAPNNVLDYGV